MLQCRVGTRPKFNLKLGRVLWNQRLLFNYYLGGRYRKMAGTTLAYRIVINCATAEWGLSLVSTFRRACSSHGQEIVETVTMSHGKLLRCWKRDGVHPNTILNECVCHNGTWVCSSAIQTRTVSHSNCLYSLRNSNLGGTLWLSKSLYQT